MMKPPPIHFTVILSQITGMSQILLFAFQPSREDVAQPRDAAKLPTQATQV
jgi:hypothetical protein